MDGKVLGRTLVALGGITLGTYDGIELGWLEGSTDGAVDVNIGGYFWEIVLDE